MQIPTHYELRQKRLEAGLTQSELAKAAGVSQALIARIEKGDVDPRTSTLRKILEAIESAGRKIQKAKDVMSSPVKSIEGNETVEKAIGIMRRSAISQLPVFNDGIPVGSLSEKDILKKIEASPDPKKLKETQVSKIMHDVSPIVPQSADVRSIYPLLEYNPSVLVMNGKSLLGIITRADVIDILKK